MSTAAFSPRTAAFSPRRDFGHSPFDARTGVEMEFLTFGQFFNGDAFTIGDFVDRIRGKVGALKK